MTDLQGDWTAAAALDPQANPARATATVLRPRHQHAVAHLYVGLRGLTSLAEEGLVSWFRVRGISPSVLFHRYGRKFAIVDGSSLCSGTLSLDEEVVAIARPVGPRHFDVRILARDGGSSRIPIRSRFTAVLIRRPGRFEESPEEVAGMLVDSLDERPPTSRDPAHRMESTDMAGRLGDPHRWGRPWRLPLDASHQHACHLEAVCELTEAFLDSHGVSTHDLLERHGLMTVTPRVRVRVLTSVRPADSVTVHYQVQAVACGLFDCRFHAYLVRGGRPVPAATGILLLGFADVDDPTGTPVPLQPAIIARMTDVAAGCADLTVG